MIKAFDGSSPKDAIRYKLFAHDGDILRENIFQRLRYQFIELGLCREDTKISLALACGRIATAFDRDALRAHFQKHGWELLDENWITERIQKMASEGYENHMAVIVSKLLDRNGAKCKANLDGS